MTSLEHLVDYLGEDYSLEQLTEHVKALLEKTVMVECTNAPPIEGVFHGLLLGTHVALCAVISWSDDAINCRAIHFSRVKALWPEVKKNSEG